MGVRVVFPDMGKDPSVQLIEKTITENGTYDAITDGANGYSKVNVNVEGGGSSDFSTANMTLVGGGTPPAINIGIVFINPIFDDLEGNPIETGIASGTYVIPLYKGRNVAFIDPANNYTVTGNATVDEEGTITITGDCTISSNQ